MRWCVRDRAAPRRTVTSPNRVPYCFSRNAMHSDFIAFVGILHSASVFALSIGLGACPAAGRDAPAAELAPGAAIVGAPPGRPVTLGVAGIPVLGKPGMLGVAGSPVLGKPGTLGVAGIPALGRPGALGVVCADAASAKVIIGPTSSNDLMAILHTSGLNYTTRVNTMPRRPGAALSCINLCGVPAVARTRLETRRPGDAAARSRAKAASAGRSEHGPGRWQAQPLPADQA